MIPRIFGAVTGGRLNLRAAANSSAAIIASIPNETLLFLSEYNDTWYAACYGAHTGFVKKQYIALMEWASAIEMSGTVTGGVLNLRRTASISADRLIQIPDNTVIINAQRKAGQQYKAQDKKDKGDSYYGYF